MDQADGRQFQEFGREGLRDCECHRLNCVPLKDIEVLTPLFGNWVLVHGQIKIKVIRMDPKLI